MVFVLSYKLMRNQIKKDEATVIQISESHWRLYILTYPSAHENPGIQEKCFCAVLFWLFTQELMIDILFYLITLYYSFHHGIFFV